MKKFLIVALLATAFVSCRRVSKPNVSGTMVSNKAQLYSALQNAQPGDEIIMANQVWTDVEMRVSANGTKENPITLKAETAGMVFIEGQSDLKLGGAYLVVEGLHFRNGASPSKAVIEFEIDNEHIANHCKITQCVIQDFNKPQRNETDLWVLFRGRNNELSNCYIVGKSNRGPTVRVDLEGNESIKNYHHIVNNHFGPRPPKGGPSAETIQIGNSHTSMAPSYTLVANNLFERCNGEVEIISSKSNFNEFKNNVFFKSEGSLVTRHGNYCLIDGNYFIGDDESENIGGIRLIGTGHKVINNYMLNLKGKEFRSPLAVMNGIPKSPQNRYTQVTDVVIAYNSYINCAQPLHFGVGSNIDQREVLPASEIRSEVPERTIVANNLFYNAKGDSVLVVAHDRVNEIDFENNVINNQGVNFEYSEGFKSGSFELKKLNKYLMLPVNLPENELYVGFEFETIDTDLFGNSRKENNQAGAIAYKPETVPNILDSSKYGAKWFTANPKNETGAVHSVSAEENNLKQMLDEAKQGDVIELNSGDYMVNTSLKINKSIALKGKENVTITYTGEKETPLFEMQPKGKLTLKNISLKGTGTQNAFAPLKENMNSLYNLYLTDCSIENFAFVLKASKYSFSEYVVFENCTIKNCTNGIVLAAEDDDKGDYNAENLTVKDCNFENVKSNVINYYRGGYDESTVGGNLKVTNSTFTNCGANEKSETLLNTYGIINVLITDNTFKNNPVDRVALLWGAKNNVHSNNTIINSGKIVVEENLKLKLLY